MMGDLLLINGQWQGAGRLSRIPLGANVIEYLLHRKEPKRVVVDQNVFLEKTQGIRGLPALVSNAIRTRELLKQHSFERVYNLGGDCGSELIPISFLNERLEGTLEVIWFDAHADLNTPESSPSGSFHGMVLRTLLGDGPTALTRYVPIPLEPSRVHLVGVRDLDRAESEFIEKHGISLHACADIEGLIEGLVQISASSQGVYIHVDYDVLDESEYADISFPTPGGMSIDSLISALQTLRSQLDARIVGMSLTEYSPIEPAKPSASLMRLLRDGFGIDH